VSGVERFTRGFYGALSTLRYFYFVFTSAHYTGIYACSVAVPTMQLPIRVSNSCGELYTYLTSAFIVYLADQLAVQGLSAVLSVIYGSTCLAVRNL